MNHRTVLLTTLAIAALAACSSLPPRNAALEQARLRYNALQTEPQVVQYAADESRRAAAALQRAEQAQAAGQSMVDVDHLAYMTSQRITIAQETAGSRAAQAVVAKAGAERDRIRLAQRTQEADSAQRQLATSEQDSARKSVELALAGRSAQDDQTRLALRDAQLGSLEQQLKDLNAQRTERGIVVTLGDMLFDSGRSQLQSGGATNMMRLADFLKRNPQRQASIEGYTDNVGSESRNQDLSDRRAHAVMAALIGMGVGAERLQARGHGEAQPVAGNDSAAGRQQNRRVEVLFAAESGDILTK